MKNYFYSFFALAALLASCSSDREDIQVDDKSASDVKYLLSSKPFEFEDDTDTRVTFKLDEKKNQLTFGWSYNEKFGVFPIKPTNSQAVWELKKDNQCDVFEDSHSSIDTHYAIFEGEGWALSPGVKYAAYQPYQDVLTSTPYTAVPVDISLRQFGYLGDIQAYDFLYAVGTYEKLNENNHYSHVIFDFNHAISIIQVTMKNVPNPTEFKFHDAVITAKSEVFIHDGLLNVETGDVTAHGDRGSYIDVYGLETEGPESTFYVALFPTETGECTIRVNDNYEFTVPSKKLVKGKAYRWTIDFNDAKIVTR